MGFNRSNTEQISYDFSDELQFDKPKERKYSVSLDDTFRDFLSELVGDDNIFTYEEYISRDWRAG